MFTETTVTHTIPQLLIFDWHGTLADNSGNLFAGVAQTLTTLKQNNFILALATSMTKARIFALLEENNLHNCFSAMQTGDMEYQKPDPNMLYAILTETHQNAVDAVMIGDSMGDLIMAKQAKVSAIGVLSGSDNKQMLELLKPRAVLESVNDLLDFLQVNKCN